MLYGLCQFFCNPIAGTISDRIGRRPVLLFGCAVDCVVFFAYGFVPYAWAFIALGGVMGVFDGSNTACFATVVDATTQGFMIPGAPLPGGSARELWLTRALYWAARDPKTAAAHAAGEPPDMNYEFSLIYMIMWAWSLTGMIFGIMWASMLVDYLGYGYTLASAGVLLAPCWIYLAATQPETLPAESRAPVTMEAICDALTSQMTSVRLLCFNHRLRLLTAINFISTTMIYGAQNILLYWYEYKFDFNSGETALILIEMLVMLTFWGFVLVRFSLKRFGFSATFGGTLFATGAVTLGQCFAYDGYAMFLFGAFTSALWSVQPLIGATMTPEVPYEDQGRLQGALYSLQMLANLIGSYGFLKLYIATRGNYTAGSAAARQDLWADSVLFVEVGACFVCAALCYATPDPEAETQALSPKKQPKGGGHIGGGGEAGDGGDGGDSGNGGDGGAGAPGGAPPAAESGSGEGDGCDGDGADRGDEGDGAILPRRRLGGGRGGHSGAELTASS